MKKVLVPVADGFEEIETATIIDVLRRAGMDVVVAGVKPGPLKGSRRVKIMPDVLLDDVANQNFDAIVLPGGQPGVDNLRKEERILELLRKMNGRKKIIGAICAAPLALRDAGIAKGVKLTSHPSIESDMQESQYQQARVVMDGPIITSRGPGTAIEFSLKLVEILENSGKSQQLAEAMLAQR